MNTCKNFNVEPCYCCKYDALTGDETTCLIAYFLQQNQYVMNYLHNASSRFMYWKNYFDKHHGPTEWIPYYKLSIEYDEQKDLEKLLVLL